jgi:hypothetical protein
MKCRSAVVACTVIAMGWGCNATGQQVVSQPTLKVGDYWAFSADTKPYDKSFKWSRKIVSISPEGLVQVLNEAGKIANYDLAMNYSFSSPKNRPILIRYPAKVGDEWTWSQKFDEFYGGPKWTAKIVASEKITVPAGTFDCLRIVAESSYTYKTYTTSSTWTRWYCSDVKWIAKEHVETHTFKPYEGGTEVSISDSELIKFTAGE